MSAQTKPESTIVIPTQSFSTRNAPAVSTMPQQASPDALLHAITVASSNPDMDIEKMERLFAMHERLVKHQAERAFSGALSRAQELIAPIARNRTNEHTRSTYADLEAINEAIVPIYTAQGLSVSFDTETKNDADPIPPGTVRVIAIVGHAEGFSRRHHIDLLPDDAGSQGKVNKTKVQAAGSTNAYGRRYLLKMIFNIAEADNDGNEDKDKDKKDKTLPAYTLAQVEANLPAWQKFVADGTKTAEQICIMIRSRFELPLDLETHIRDTLKGASS